MVVNELPLDDEIFEKCPNQFLRNDQIEIILLKRRKEIIDKNEQKKLIKMYHDDPAFGGHLSSIKVYKKMKYEFYWKTMLRDINRYVKSCEKCMLTKIKPSNREEMTITRTPVEPFDILVVDTVGPLPKSTNGNIYIVTMMCELSKYLITVPTPDNRANTVAKAIMENFILKWLNERNKNG